MDESGKVNRSELELATGEILKSSFYTPDTTDDYLSELNKDLIKFAIDNTSHTHDGRLVMPLLWRTDVSHLLGRNYKLAKAILDSNFKKLIKKDEGHGRPTLAEPDRQPAEGEAPTKP